MRVIFLSVFLLHPFQNKAAEAAQENHKARSYSWEEMREEFAPPPIVTAGLRRQISDFSTPPHRRLRQAFRRLSEELQANQDTHQTLKSVVCHEQLSDLQKRGD